MSVMENWPRVEANSPDRCGGSTGNGQCWLQRVENSEYCPVHGGGKQLKANKKEVVEKWHIKRFKDRVDAHSGVGIKDLSVQIGMLNSMLEVHWNSCEDDTALMMKSGLISDLVVKIEKLVTAANTLDMKLGEMLNKTDAMSLAQSIVAIIAEEVHDLMIVEKVTERIAALLETSDD